MLRCFLFFFIMMMGYSSSWAQGTFLRIGTGASSGTYFLMGGLLANAISNPTGSRPCDKGGSCGVSGLVAVAQSTEGSIENINLIQKGGLESALVQADLAFYSFYGVGPFKKKEPAKHLRVISRLYDDVIHFVVKSPSPVGQLKDMKGRTFSLGEELSGTAATMQILLPYHGISLKSFRRQNLKLDNATDALEKGNLDGFFIIGGPPLPAIQDLAVRIPIALVPIPFDPLMDPSFYHKATLSKDTYVGTATTETIGVPVLWVVSDALSQEMVYAMTAALWHPSTQAFLANGHHQGKSLTLKRALDGVNIPLHAGAEQYYRDQGIIHDAAIP